MTRILVIDDEAEIHTILNHGLSSLGYDVLSCFTAEEGLRLSRELRPELVVLDWMLPDMTGTEVCRTLKADPATARIAIIICSAKDEEIDRVVGFEVGADDYVCKPFSVRELCLRIRAVIRRQPALVPILGGRGSELTFGRLRIDREAHRVWVGAKEIELTLLEFKLLVALCEQRERVMTRAALLNQVWGLSEANAEEQEPALAKASGMNGAPRGRRGPQRGVVSRTVDAHVKRLREKLAEAGDSIETVRGVGYRFTLRL